MSKLKMKTKKIHCVDYSDLESFIQECFELPARFEILESGNDITHNFTVTPDVYDEEEVKGYINSGGVEYYFLGDLLNYMCKKALIPKGNYNIEVSW